MAAMVQSYPQQSGSVTMLQTRSTSGQSQAPQQYSVGQQQRNGYQPQQNLAASQTAYRGTSTPIQPYAFTATPALTPAAQWQQFRAQSTSAIPTTQNFEHNMRPRYPANPSMSNPSIHYAHSGSRDDTAITGVRRVAPTPRPQSAFLPGAAQQVTLGQATPVKLSPERYRRPAPRVIDVSHNGHTSRGPVSAPAVASNMPNVARLYSNQIQSQEQNYIAARNQAMPLGQRPNSLYGPVAGSAADDIQVYRMQQDEAKRNRRRSMPSLDSTDYPHLAPPTTKQPGEMTRTDNTPSKTTDKDSKPTRLSPSPATHTRNPSSESLASSRSSNSRPSSSANRSTTNFANPTGNPASAVSTVNTEQNASGQDHVKAVNVPARGSSSDATSRIANPSPLSRPVKMESDAASADPAGPAPVVPSIVQSPSASSVSQNASPAVKQLAALNAKGGKLKSKTSRLRRAFSFGSAAEFRTAGGEESGDGSAGPTKLHKEPTPEEIYDAEQERIAQQQEEAGIGNSIYAGARIFTGSTDNLSISSTASSASIMIRKMGRGMKKGGRSLVGLFRPKSVIGVPAADAPLPETSQAAVSMITVEAERERLNINVDPHDQHGGGTGFPRLERNSIDASKVSGSVERLGSSGTDSSAQRKSIVGGEKERAEVLAAVRKGILKKERRDSSNSSRQPGDGKVPAFDLPNVPHVTDSPFSSAPSTPNDESSGHKRNGSVTIGNEDYFMSALRLRQDTKSAPSTPQGTLKRNATFSPRIVFHDTWPSQEYDRRGEIATCNRLTPMLAQQIKEELNSFKMEMEVHENSKIYTHFF